MSQQRCDQGHYYDTSLHRRCPSCGVTGLDLSPTIPHEELDAAPAPAGGWEAEDASSAAAAPRRGSGSRNGSGGGAGNGTGFDGGGSDVRRTYPYGGALRDEGLTVAFWRRPRSDGPPVEDGPPADPVVGWLVAIEGPDGIKGRDYRIYSEGNPIGRENHHRIVIKDESVARDVHAVVTYDPRSEDHAFYLTPGGRHMVYRLNRTGGTQEVPVYAREAIVQATRLRPFDKLEIGKTRLLFVPLCGTDFHWVLEQP